MYGGLEVGVLDGSFGIAFSVDGVFFGLWCGTFWVFGVVALFTSIEA